MCYKTGPIILRKLTGHQVPKLMSCNLAKCLGVFVKSEYFILTL